MTKILREKYMFIFLLFGTILLFDYGIANTIVSNIRISLASTFLSVGIIGLVADFLMRDEIKAEMIRLVGIQSSIITNKIEDAGSQEDMKWDEFLRNGTNFKFVLSDAEGWIKENWARLERRAEEVPIQVEVYIPDPESGYISFLSQRNGHTGDRLPRACEELRDTLETLWKGMAAKPQTQAGSKVSILYLSTIPGYSLVSSEGATHLLISPPVSKNLARLPFRLSFRAPMHADPVVNFHHRVSPADASALVYENVVKR